MKTGKRSLRYYIITVITAMILCLIPLAAQSQSVDPEKEFNTTHANEVINTVESKIIKPKASQSNLDELLLKTQKVKDQAKECLSNMEDKVDSINNLLKKPSKQSSNTLRANVTTEALKKSEDVKPTADIIYLKEKLHQYKQKSGECRLLVFKSSEITGKIKEIIQDSQKRRIYHHTTPIWKLFELNTLHSLQRIEVKTIQNISGLHGLNKKKVQIFIIILIASMIISAVITNFCSRWLHAHKESNFIQQSLASTLRNFVTPILLFLVTSVYLTLVYSEDIITPTIELASYAFLLYSVAIALVSFIAYSPNLKRNLLSIPKTLGKMFFNRFWMIASLMLLFYLYDTALRQQGANIPFHDMVRIIYVSCLSFSIAYFCWLFFSLPKLANLNWFIKWLLKVSIVAFFSSIIITEWLGYHELAFYLTYTISLSILAISLFWISINFTGSLHGYLIDSHHPTSRKLHRFFGVKSHKVIYEFVLLKAVFYLFITAILILYLMTLWGAPAIATENLKYALTTGFFMADINIVPTDLLLALVLFSILNLSGRAIASLIGRKRRFRGEHDTQIAMVSIFTYISFTVSLILALLISGFNFTGIAIVAGALSVGIGLGLQNIVNNFVSGVILLLEKPIKPGDRISINNVEGYVKRIRIRSTQITTRDREDVIIPNSDLISKQVTNYMFRDQIWRVICPVSVAYGSNVDDVKQVLLNVAKNNPHVLQEVPNKPNVLLRSFGENSLQFELRCVIDDVNLKNITLSELNFSIAHAFKEHNITIPFPQRDIHLIKDKSK